MSEQQSAAQAVIDALADRGVTRVFGLPGTTDIPLLNALAARPGMQYLMGLHEGGVAAAADGFARASRRPGIALIHTLPGTANALGPLSAANRDRSPVVYICGQQDNRILGQDSYTEAPDLPELPRSLCKWSWEVTRAERAVEAVVRAYKTAQSPPPGPTYVSIPKNLMREQVPAVRVPPEQFDVTGPLWPDPGLVDRAVRMLRGARQPVIIAGDDVVRDDASAILGELALKLGAPVFQEPHNAYVGLSLDHPAYLGQLDEASPWYREADVVLAVGARLFVDMEPRPKPPFEPGMQVIHSHPLPTEIAKIYPVALGITASSGAMLRALDQALGKIESGEIAARRAAVAQHKADLVASWSQVADHGKDPITAARIAHILATIADPSTLIVDESVTGRGSMQRCFVGLRPDQYFASSAAHLGWGVGAAIGVQAARPANRVVGFIGDGSFILGLQALWMAPRYDLPVVYVVVNNRAYMAIKARLYYQHGDRADEVPGGSIDRPAVDFVSLAEGFGVSGCRVENEAELRPALERAFGLGKPALIEVVTDPKQAGFGWKRLLKENRKVEAVS